MGQGRLGSISRIAPTEREVVEELSEALDEISTMLQPCVQRRWQSLREPPRLGGEPSSARP